MYKIQGSIVMIGETIQVTEKFAKRDLVIEDASSMYPQEILFQLAQDKTKILDGLAEGEWVEVSFNLRGRSWQKDPDSEKRWFNTLDAWRVEKVQGMSQPTPPPAQNSKPQTSNTEPPKTEDGDDDLPF